MLLNPPHTAVLLEGRGEMRSFRGSGSSAPEWSLWHIRKGEKKKRVLLFLPLNGFLDQEWDVDRNQLARFTFMAQREGKVVRHHLPCRWMLQPRIWREKRHCGWSTCTADQEHISWHLPIKGYFESTCNSWGKNEKMKPEFIWYISNSSMTSD